MAEPDPEEGLTAGSAELRVARLKDFEGAAGAYSHSWLPLSYELPG